MNVLMVIESMFGNTRQVGEAVAASLSRSGATVRLVGIADAPAEIPSEVDLVVIGAPTHSRGLSTASTRAQAGPGGPGVKDWLEGITFPANSRIAVFDTCTSRNWMSGSAAKAAVKLLARRGIPATARTFLVRATQGPLQPGELESADAWGTDLAT
ncbi:MAG: flavodoxin/nitric oxide synthase [Propioniciclava sp.]|uniref:flavodoxin/nitric oxide synthase n=1 Tax=Propioniciclava sp. TaxID=2038686 RepID=UPI0039E4FD83